MIKILKNAFILLKQNSIFIQPLILFFILVSFLDGFVINLRNISIPAMIVLIGLFLLFSAVSAGWFYICRLAVNNSKMQIETAQERDFVAYESFKKYFIGVGENALSVLLINVLWLAFACVGAYFLYKFGVAKIGSPKVIFEMVASLALSPEQDRMQIMQNFYTPHNVILVFSWFFASFIYSHLTTFVFILLNVVYSSLKLNPFVSIYKTLLFALKKCFSLFALFIITLIMSFIAYVILAISSINVILSAFALLFVFLYFNYMVFLVFLFYEEETKSNSDSGRKLDREI